MHFIYIICTGGYSIIPHLDFARSLAVLCSYIQSNTCHLVQTWSKSQTRPRTLNLLQCWVKQVQVGIYAIHDPWTQLVVTETLTRWSQESYLAKIWNAAVSRVSLMAVKCWAASVSVLRRAPLIWRLWGKQWLSSICCWYPGGWH